MELCSPVGRRVPSFLAFSPSSVQDLSIASKEQWIEGSSLSSRSGITASTLTGTPREDSKRRPSVHNEISWAEHEFQVDRRLARGMFLA